jgi:hypothetical protein
VLFRSRLHDLIERINGTYRYFLTPLGKSVVAASVKAGYKRRHKKQAERFSSETINALAKKGV